MKTQASEPTKAQRFWQNFVAILKIVGTVLALIFTGKVLYDLFGASEKVGARIKEFRTKSWRRDPNDPDKPLAPTDDFDGKDFDKEIEKLEDIK